MDVNLTADWFDEFFSEGLITEVVTQLKSGKEATVFICRGGAASERALLAVKSYRERCGRGFQNRAAYQDGRFTGGTRPARAVATKTRFGRHVEEAQWVGHEFDMLCRLYDAGADVPQPLAATNSAILMEFMGDDNGVAQQLREFRPAGAQAQPMFARLMWNVERFLANNIIHGDLSAYNILVFDGHARIIDFPQAVDPRTNAFAHDLLRRDVDHLCHYFERFGVRADADRLSGDLWRRFLNARL